MAEEEIATPQPAEEPKPEKELPRWEQRSELKIQGKMREVVKLTITASEKEIEHLRRKVKKLTYGS